MSLEALASAELPSFLVYDTISASPLLHRADPSSSSSIGLFDDAAGMMGSFPAAGKVAQRATAASTAGAAAGGGKRKRRRTRTTTCKNKEEAENQRMTHIAVERNRRRQMNDHLAVLRSLMPESYIQRGDQASIVGGAIDFVKELEQLLQSLEAQKRALQQQQADAGTRRGSSSSSSESSSSSNTAHNNGVDSPPFSDFFSFPQYSWFHTNQDHAPPEPQPPALADIEVTLIETHANVRILSPKRPGQLFQMMAGLQNLRLTVLHLNVTSLDSMALYSLSLKVEEGCGLSSVDDIAAAIHQMLSLIEAEVTAAAAAAAAAMAQ